MAAFEELGLMPELSQACLELGWQLPKSVQAEVIPLILGGGDVLAAAETGEGKTGSFVVPLVQLCQEVHRQRLQGTPEQSSSSGPADWTDREEGLEELPSGEQGGTLRVQGGQWRGARASKGLKSANLDAANVYYEVRVESGSLVRVGYALGHASLSLGTDAYGYGYGSTGKKASSKRFEDFGEAFGPGDVIGVQLNLPHRQLSYYKNGRPLGVAFDLPAAQLQRFVLYPAVCLKDSIVSVHLGEEGMSWWFPPDHPEASTFLSVKQASSTAMHPSESKKTAPKGAKRVRMSGPTAVVVEPTLELATQTYELACHFGAVLGEGGLHVQLMVAGGGKKAQQQMKQASSHSLDIVVATPGRLEAAVSSGELSLNHVRFFVLDEADRLIEMGQGAFLVQLLARMPVQSHRVQVMMFSATLHTPEVREYAGRLCSFPTWVDLKGKLAVPDAVAHFVVPIDPVHLPAELRAQLAKSWHHDGMHPEVSVADASAADAHSRAEVLSEAIKLAKPWVLKAAIDANQIEHAIVFVRTRVEADHLEKWMNRLTGGGMLASRYSARAFHSGLGAAERKKVYDMFKRLEFNFLICTDVAARGLDIRELQFVLNLTLPSERDDYVHRVGRVGRAGRKGVALSLVSTVPEKVWFHRCKDKGAKCNNRLLLEERGCAMWLDEPDLLAAISDRLGGISIPSLSLENLKVPDLSLTDASAQKNLSAFQRLAELVPSLSSATLSDLSDLEDRLQRHYWGLQLLRSPSSH